MYTFKPISGGGIAQFFIYYQIRTARGFYNGIGLRKE